MRKSNPVLSSLTATRYQGQQTEGQGIDPYGANYAAPANAETARPMTVDDVVSKTGITLGVIVLGALVTYFIGNQAPGIASMLTFVGGIGGLITVLVSAFSRKYGSKTVTLLYAGFEGLFVGGLTFAFANMMVESVSAGVLVGQALLGTVGVFAGMLWVYKTGTVKVTPKFTRILQSAMVGLLVLVGGNFVFLLITGNSPLYDGGPIAIVFSLVCIGLAAMSFLQDFDVADRLVHEGAPAQYAWGVALGLAVTLVWLYTEILRLLSYFYRR